MANNRPPIEYACTRCGIDADKADLTARKVVFSDLGFKGTVIRTRTTDWLCQPCIRVDADWNFPANRTAKQRAQDARQARLDTNNKARTEQLALFDLPEGA